MNDPKSPGTSTRASHTTLRPPSTSKEGGADTIAPLRTFAALLEAIEDDALVLRMLPGQRRRRLRTSQTYRALLVPCVGTRLVFTVHGDELVNASGERHPDEG